ncbi:MAG TPA: imidazolonepropionase [Ignavibacteriaceae bacterium]|nr:imidazolonepropionase [Ignavibacteriaceae bacterium]HRQ54915.1 imidazolonepropionase [Ignavibacteriaceae bacterium]
MKTLFTNAAQIVTCNSNGKNLKRGKDLSEIFVLENHSILVEDGIIKDILPYYSTSNIQIDKKINLSEKVILPGLIDCHTHTAFAGSRANEFREKIAGVHYEEIAKRGGGINTTVTAVRNSSLTELVELMKPRVQEFIAQGVTTLEIKSGYGLDFENEIKLLHAIKIINEIFPIDIVSTFLGAHTFPVEFKEDHSAYVDLLINKMIPHITKNNLAEFCDGFCESTAFTSKQIDRIFTAAANAGLKLKLHTEQFNNVGGLDVALKHNATSVDHLEVLSEKDFLNFSTTETVAVLLPGVSLFLDYQFAPARMLIENNAIIALATDYNPGSSHILNLHLIMSLAAIKMKMKIEEIINAVTINSAKALNREKIVGSIEIGKNADFAVFNTEDYSDIIYNVGRNLLSHTIKSGEIVFQK